MALDTCTSCLMKVAGTGEGWHVYQAGCLGMPAHNRTDEDVCALAHPSVVPERTYPLLVGNLQPHQRIFISEISSKGPNSTIDRRRCTLSGGLLKTFPTVAALGTTLQVFIVRSYVLEQCETALARL